MFEVDVVFREFYGNDYEIISTVVLITTNTNLMIIKAFDN